MIYSLDTNVLIQAWNGYYSPDFCADYWNCMDNLIQAGIIFIAEEVYRELEKEDDDLFQWAKSRKDEFVHEIDDDVEDNLKRIYDFDPKHRRLVDSIRSRSIADPWVIAHAITDNAIVVTKENFETQSNKRIKIPNVCENMGVQWINDFQFIKDVQISFTAQLNLT